jgi:hypothetical protein
MTAQMLLRQSQDFFRVLAGHEAEADFGVRR